MSELPIAGLMKVGRYASVDEANIYAAALTASGIESQIFGSNANAWTGLQNLSFVELFVAKADGARAREILSHPEMDDVEPVEDDENSPKADEQGRPLVPLAAYENIRDLRDAMTVLASGEVTAFAPKLMPRGDRPAGQGNRFILRVAEDDLEVAQSLLAEEAEEDQDEPRCPKCGAWRVHAVSTFFKEIASAFGPPKRPGEMECTACKYRGKSEEFWPAE